MDKTKTELGGLSESLMELVASTAAGVVAVKGGAYRTASGVSLRENIVAMVDSTLRREERVPVHAFDGSQGVGTLVGRDSRTHTVFLKVDNLALKPLATADLSRLKAGMLAVVVGLTTDAGPSASLGILGAVGGPRRTWRGGAMDHFIRLDANVYPSQAGAAVVDWEGQLIGMATPGLLQYSTVAMPVSNLDRSLDELLKRGRIRQGYIGVGIQRVSIRALPREQVGNDQESGLIILNVESGSPAEKAGLQLGDILLSLAGKALADVDDLQDILTGENIQRELDLIISRGGQVLRLEITVAEREKRER